MEKHRNLVNNTSENRYEMEVEGQKAYVDYRTYPDVIELTYTYVPQSCRGKRFGGELVESVLEHVRAQRLKVIPRCGFIARGIQVHPEWEGIVATETVRSGE
ncbi:MAG: N-acetyltransferase [Alistipes sp.]|nr:N-acetyltransferase [Alistipes sp.]